MYRNDDDEDSLIEDMGEGGDDVVNGKIVLKYSNVLEKMGIKTRNILSWYERYLPWKWEYIPKICNHYSMQVRWQGGQDWMIKIS